MPSSNDLFACGLSKTDAVSRLATRADLNPSEIWAGTLRQHLETIQVRLGRPVNGDINWETDSSRFHRDVIFNESSRPLPPPTYLTSRPASFPDFPDSSYFRAFSPPAGYFRIPGGHVGHLHQCPVIFDEAGGSVVVEASSAYAGLIYFYDLSIKQVMSKKRVIDGRVICIADIIRPLNYSHWLSDWLPRLAPMGPIRPDGDVYVAITPMQAPFQRESLAACGFGADRIVEIEDDTIIQARELLAPLDFGFTPHPAYKTAPWAVSYLRSTVGYGVAFPTRASPKHEKRRIYISRADAGYRKILNETELVRSLDVLGFETHTLAALTIRDQAALFGSASHIVGLHGAGLTNLIFAEAGGSICEIFPASYGTPAFYDIAAGVGMNYANYVCDGTIRTPISTMDNVELDVPDFIRRYRSWLGASL